MCLFLIQLTLFSYKTGIDGSVYIYIYNYTNIYIYTHVHAKIYVELIQFMRLNLYSLKDQIKWLCLHLFIYLVCACADTYSSSCTCVFAENMEQGMC